MTLYLPRTKFLVNPGEAFPFSPWKGFRGHKILKKKTCFLGCEPGERLWLNFKEVDTPDLDFDDEELDFIVEYFVLCEKHQVEAFVKILFGNWLVLILKEKNGRK